MESSIRLQTNDQQSFPKYYEPAFSLTSVHSNDFSHQVFPSLQTLSSHVYCYGNHGTSKSRMYIYWLLIFWISKAMESTMLKRSKMVRWDVAFLGVTGFTGCLYPKEQRETKVSLTFSTGCHEVKHACFTMFTLVLFLVSLWVWFSIFLWFFDFAMWLTCRWVLLLRLYPCLLINNCTCEVP